jgi:hypothetical protein
MGFNMLSCPAVDCIDGIWDTQSNSCSSIGEEKENLYAQPHPFTTCEEVKYSVPIICDEDVRSVTLRLRQNIMMVNCKRVDDR